MNGGLYATGFEHLPGCLYLIGCEDNRHIREGMFSLR